MKIIKILFSAVIMIILVISAFILGEKRGTQSVYDMLKITYEGGGQQGRNGKEADADNEESGYDVYSELAEQGVPDDCGLSSSVYWYECENNYKHDIVAFGVIAETFDITEDENTHVQYCFLIDSAGRVYCGNYSGKGWDYDTIFSLLSRDNAEYIDDMDEELFLRVKYITSDWNNYRVDINKKSEEAAGCDCRVYLVKHNEDNVIEGITLYDQSELDIAYNANPALDDLGKDLLKYFAKLYGDKTVEDYKVRLEPELF